MLAQNKAKISSLNNTNTRKPHTNIAQVTRFEMSFDTGSKLRLTDCGNESSRMPHSEEISSIDIPVEIFCHVISFLGPRSTDLVNLSETNSRYNRLMKLIGDAMLKRANAVFWGNIRRTDQPISSIALFVRLSQECHQVQGRIDTLKRIFKKAFNGQLMSPQIDSMLDYCLDLLSKRCSRHQEREIISLCGKIGGKAYKESKKDHMKSISFSTDYRRKACLVMSIVAFRKLKLSKLSPR